jgi:uncharacterized membrane protein (UPF0127 family)
LILISSACGPPPEESLRIQNVTLPGGEVVHAEVALTQQDITKGLMFRKTIAPDHGMLFVFPQPGLFPFWMYQCEMSIDMVWLDTGKNVTEIQASAPPCRGAASTCPHYGGTEMSQYVLELGSGMAAKYGLHKGSQLTF